MMKISHSKLYNTGNLWVLPLERKLYELQSALIDKWEKKDYGHNFEDFVIEVFDMKITEGKVKILIELGS